MVLMVARWHDKDPHAGGPENRSLCFSQGEVAALVYLGLEYQKGTLVGHLGAKYKSPCHHMLL